MTAPQTIGKKFAQLERETLRQWKTWAEAIAEGGPAPSPLDVLNAASILGVDGPPAVALESDSEAITLVANLDARVAERQAAYDALVEQHGGRDGIAVKLVEANEELRRLEEIQRAIVGGPGTSHHRQEAGRLRSQHPRVFQEGGR
jgi:hypothetical protein